MFGRFKGIIEYLAVGWAIMVSLLLAAYFIASWWPRRKRKGDLDDLYKD